MATTHQLVSDASKRRLHPLPHGSTQQQEPSPVPRPRAAVREAEKVEGLRRSSKAPFLSIGGRMATELDQTSLFGVQFE